MSTQPNATRYYFRIRGRVQGPFDLARAQALMRRGRLSRSHEVSLDKVHWQRAEEFPELFVAQVEEKVRAVALEESPAEASAAAADSSTTEQLWYYSLGGQEQGPVPMSRLVQMIQLGQLEPDSLVWTEGMEQWTPWQSVPALRIYAPSAEKETSSSTSSSERASAGRPAVSGMAVTSLILGSAFWGTILALIGTVAIGSVFLALVLPIATAVAFVVAVVLAHLALADLRHRREVAGRGLAITGLVMAYAGLAVVVLFFILALVGAVLLGELGRLIR